MTPAAPSSVTRADLYTWFFAVAAMALVLVLHLLPALLAGLMVYELVHVLASRFGLRSLGSDRAKIVSVALIAALVITLLTLTIAGTVSFFRHGNDSLPALLQKLAEIIEATRDQLPDWLLQYLPADTEELRTALAEWLRKHAGALPLAGKGLALGIAHVLIGMVVGALLALKQPVPLDERRPVARAVAASTERLGDAFRRVVFAQAWIASINTTFTAIYLVVIMPLLGVHLPLVKTLIAVTFIAGLMPIIGNLLSNSIIVLVSLSHSLPVALGSLAFLISVHKLEYFLNARIIGSHIRAQAWELLIAMVVMEALFGIAGLIAAPIYYAWVKDELSKKSLI